jgi:uncharacterized YkwD family protein
MNKKLKVFVGIQTVLLMTAVAMPAQAALLIGGSQPLSGSVVTLHSYAPTTTSVQGTQTIVSTPSATTVQNPAMPSQPINVGISGYSSVVSLKNIGTQTTISAPVATNQQTATTSQNQTITIGQPTLGGSVVSLKGYINQPAPAPVTTTPSTPTSTTIPAPTTTPTTSSTGTPSNTPSTPTIPLVSAITPEEQQMVDMINQERAAAGVAPLKVDLRLVSVGQAKADDMKANNYFDHTSPTYGSPWAMMQQVGLTVGWAGENIAGNNSVSGAMAALMQSPDHKANILDPRFTHVGIGIAYGSAYGNLYVQEFLQE